jgi:hypothetical protein
MIMLDDIRLTPKQLEILQRAAEHVGANLVTDYRGPFCAPARVR